MLEEKTEHEEGKIESEAIIIRSKRGRTNKRDEDKDDVESEAGAGGGEEGGDGANGDDDGADGDGGEQLDGDDGVDFSDEGPPQFGALEHHRVQRPRPSLHIRFLEWLIPHLHNLISSPFLFPVKFSPLRK